MTKPNISTTTSVSPMIYAYITPGVTYHDGWSKIGYTERDVEARIREQTHTAGIRWALEWKGDAVFEDGSGVTFHDKDFHVYLRGMGVEQEEGVDNEWFKITKPESKEAFDTFRQDHGVLRSNEAVVAYLLRDEQERAVKEAKEYFEGGGRGATALPEFLWNCKPRFGKTLAVYDLAKRLNAKTVLVVGDEQAGGGQLMAPGLLSVSRRGVGILVRERDGRARGQAGGTVAQAVRRFCMCEGRLLSHRQVH